MLDTTNELALKYFPTLPDEALVKRVVVQALCSCSDEQVDRLVKAGRLPKPVKLGKRTCLWRVGDLRGALARLADREPAAAADQGISK